MTSAPQVPRPTAPAALAVPASFGAQHRFGIHAGQQNRTANELMTLWRQADPYVDWISAWDHLYEAPPAGGTLPHFEALAILGALATVTERARLGCLVFYVGYRSPGVLAKAATTLDHLSNGRFEIGLGAGWHDQEARAFGYDFPGVGARLDMLGEATEIISSLLVNERTTYSGTHFRVDNASCLPLPVQSPLPIWIGGIGEKRTLRMVAELAHGWNAAYVSPDKYAELCGVLDGHCQVVGRDPASVRRSINLSFNLVSTRTGADAMVESLKAQWGPGFNRVSGGALLGTPDEAFDRVTQFLKAGAQDVHVALRYPLDESALHAYLTEVIPALHAAHDPR